MYISVCVYIYIYRERERERKRDRQTDRQRQRGNLMCIIIACHLKNKSLLESLTGLVMKQANQVTFYITSMPMSVACKILFCIFF